MRLRRAIGILGNVLVCLGLLCSLLGLLLFTRGEDHIVSVESWWWNLVLGHGVFEPWWWNWVASLGAIAVGAVLMFGIAPVLVNWAKEGKFSWHRFASGDRVIGNKNKGAFWGRKGTIVRYEAQAFHSRDRYCVQFDDGHEEYTDSHWLDEL